MLTQTAEDKPGSREARKESRSLGIFKVVSKPSESHATSPPPKTMTAEDSVNFLSIPLDLNAKPSEKTTKTTATYYPRLSRQDSLIARRDSVITSSMAKDRPATRKDTLPSSALTNLVKSGYESESGDELGEWKTPRSIALKPYCHQVGGHSALFKFSRHAVCKPLIEKENVFYQDIEINRPEGTSPSYYFSSNSLSIPVPLIKDVNGHYSAPLHASVHWDSKRYPQRLHVNRRINSTISTKPKSNE